MMVDDNEKIRRRGITAGSIRDAFSPTFVSADVSGAQLARVSIRRNSISSSTVMSLVCGLRDPVMLATDAEQDFVVRFLIHGAQRPEQRDDIRPSRLCAMGC
jgi:hypothetical protein